MKNTFSFPRFISYAQAVASSEKRGILLKGGGFILFTAMVYFLFNLDNVLGYNTLGIENERHIIAPRIIVVIAAFFLLLFNLSGSFKRFHKRTLSASSLMLPAARSEKFILPLVANLILVPLFLFLVICVVDSAYSWALGFDYSFGFNVWSSGMKLDGMTMEHEHTARLFFWLMNTGTLVSMCFYFVGSVFFRRHPFLLTLVAQNVIGILVIIGFSLLRYFVPENIVLTPEQGRELAEQVLAGGIAFNVLLIAGLIFWAWKLFKNLKVAK